MSDNTTETMDWALWFYWIMATTLGWLVGPIVGGPIQLAISGIAIAAFQWAVLFKRVQKAWQWLLLSSLGWISGYILSVIVFSVSINFMTGVVLGGLVGFTQWLLLRKNLNWAFWWIPISIIAWVTGISLIPGLLSSGALPGALTGLALVILFRFPSQNNL